MQLSIEAFENLFYNFKQRGLSNHNKRITVDNQGRIEENIDKIPALPLLKNFVHVFQRKNDNMTQLRTLYSKFSPESRDIFDFLQSQILEIMYREGQQQTLNDKCLIVQYLFAATYCFYHRNSQVVRFYQDEPAFLDYTQLAALQQVQQGRKEAFKGQITANAESINNIEVMLRESITKLTDDKQQLEEEVKFLTTTLSTQKEQIVNLQQKYDNKIDDDRKIAKFIANTQRQFDKGNRKQLRLVAKLENKARSASSMITFLQAKLSEIDTEQKGMAEMTEKMRKRKKILEKVTKSATKANVSFNNSSSDDEDENSGSSDNGEEETNVPHYAIVDDSDQDTEPLVNVDEPRAASSTPVIQQEGEEVELVAEVEMNTSSD